MMPEQEKCTAGSNRCMWPPRPRPRPVSRPKISAVIRSRSTPWAMARWCGRCVAVTASSPVRCAQTPAATGSWPAARCISPGTRPLPMSKPGPLSAWYSRRIASSKVRAGPSCGTGPAWSPRRARRRQPAPGVRWSSWLPPAERGRTRGPAGRPCCRSTSDQHLRAGGREPSSLGDERRCAPWSARRAAVVRSHRAAVGAGPRPRPGCRAAALAAFAARWRAAPIRGCAPRPRPAGRGSPAVPGPASGSGLRGAQARPRAPGAGTGSQSPPTGMGSQNDAARHARTPSVAVAAGVPSPTSAGMRNPSMTPRPPGVMGSPPTRFASP